MIERLYKKENNIFQSLNWAAFQENYGRKIIYFDNSYGIEIPLPFGKNFVWVQKESAKPSGLSKDVIFVRVEPEKGPGSKYMKVGANSLLSGQRSPKRTRVLDLEKSEDELLAAMKPKTRYNIRLAEKRGVSVKMLDNEDTLYEMLTATSKKQTGYYPHEKAYYTKMIKDLAKNDVAHIFVAEHDGDFLAAILVTFFGEVATYLHGGQNDVKKNLMAPYLCQWEAIKYAKKHGCKLYDFWGVAETDSTNDPWAGITRFKEGFGGEAVEFPGTFDLILRPFWYNLFSAGAKIRKIFK